ncbi:MAG: hypothetical protein R3Y06_00950 [Faecalibacterium sp.]
MNLAEYTAWQGRNTSRTLQECYEQSLFPREMAALEESEPEEDEAREGNRASIAL